MALCPKVPKAEENHVKFIHLNFRHGLAQSPITAMAQDQKGFVWIGNWKGLCRYDGYEFKEFRYSEHDKGAISNGRVNVIFEDKAKRLWIGTANGLNRYDREKEQFKYYGASLTIKGGLNYISGIVEDGNGDIWVSTFGGLRKVDTTKGKLHHAIYDEEIAYTLLPHNQKEMWLGTKKGVRLIDIEEKKALGLPQVIAQHKALNEAKILIIKKDLQGNFWFGAEDSGLFIYNTKEQSLTHHFIGNENKRTGIPSNWIKDILVRKNGEVWIATRNGLSVYHPQKKSFKNYTHHPGDEQSLADNSLWSLMNDQQGNVWAGTFSGKLSIHYPGNANFTNIGQNPLANKGLSNPVAHHILAENPGVIWIGTFGGGINRLDRSTNNITHYSLMDQASDHASDHIKSMALDGNGTLWIGSLNGLYSFDTKSKRKSAHKLPIPEGKLSANLVNAILTHGEHIWAGSNGGGLYQLDKKGKHLSTVRHGDEAGCLSDNFVNALLIDGDKGIWIGTQMGLNYLHLKTNKISKLYTKEDRPYSLASNDVLCLFRDSNGRLWVGTEGGALHYFDERNNRFYKIGEKLGLSDNVVHSILEDQQHAIWVSTDNGLFRIQFDGFSVPFTKENVTVSHYTANHGLPGNMFMSNAGLILPDNCMFFGSMDGLTSFYPHSLYKNASPPRLALTDFLVKNLPVNIDPSGATPLRKSVTQSDSISLEYNQGFISIKYAALNYINSENNSYAYRMEGLPDDSWHYVGDQRTANFTNLGPGEYTFEVKAANSDGIWTEAPLSLKITIHPPVWATWWAYLFYAIVAVGLMTFVLIFIRSKELLRRDLYHEQMKLDFFTKISHEIRTPVTLIAAPLERMIHKEKDNLLLSDQLIRIKAQTDRLKKLVTELLDFRKIEHGSLKLYFAHVDLVLLAHTIFKTFLEMANQKNIRYVFDAPCEKKELYADPDQIEKVLLNILSNALKFTPEGGTIKVYVANYSEKKKEGIRLAVINTGSPIPKEHHKRIFEPFVQVQGEHGDYQQGTGIGLAFAKQIVDKHGGTLSLESDAKHTVFSVQLPFEPPHLNDLSLLPEKVEQALGEQATHRPIAQTTHINATAKAQRILVVEDNESMLRFLTEVLSESYEVYTSTNGEQAWPLLLELLPDIVISDVMMPNVSGTVLCRQIKQDERTDHIPVILLTAKAANEHKIDGMSSGADCYLTKPFNTQLLELYIQNILARKEVLRKKFGKIITLQPYEVEISSPEEKLLDRLIGIIEEHMEDSNFGVPELASAIGMSKTVLYNKVQSITQLTIANFIKSIRLKKAAMLLNHASMNIAEVAFSVGFSDRKYFSKEFKKQFGHSPTEYQDSQVAPH